MLSSLAMFFFSFEIKNISENFLEALTSNSYYKFAFKIVFLLPVNPLVTFWLNCKFYVNYSPSLQKVNRRKFNMASRGKFSFQDFKSSFSLFAALSAVHTVKAVENHSRKTRSERSSLQGENCHSFGQYCYSIKIWTLNQWIPHRNLELVKVLTIWNSRVSAFCVAMFMMTRIVKL